jgi:hypothetical protein
VGLGVFLGVLFEIRTFLVAGNHMILGYKMAFSSISADPPYQLNPSDLWRGFVFYLAARRHKEVTSFDLALCRASV